MIWMLNLIPGQIHSPKAFDRSLDALERQRVITSRERRVLEGRNPRVVPIDRKRFERACQSGALSRQECSRGLAQRLRKPSQVGVSAMTPRPRRHSGNGDKQLLFPVIGQAYLSSGFGWRHHPILGRWLMHAGRDYAAATGTPVVAALSGRVVSSGRLGGYGLAIEVEHRNPTRRTLYGHLSELYVRAGERVQQGDVIGRVGSTGMSTGPHLHFELLIPTSDGWRAVDPVELGLSSSIPTGAESRRINRVSSMGSIGRGG